MNQRTLKLTDDEKSLINTSTDIPGTQWSVIDLEDRQVFHLHLLKNAGIALIIFLCVLAFTLIMRSRILKYFSLLSNMTMELAEKNRDVMKLNEKLQNISITDPLTGIYSRRYFDQHFEKEWLRAQRNNLPLSLLMIDIDFFKQYNDSYGHLQGDECLKLIAEKFNASLNRGNEFIARYGGEEFVAVINDDTQTTLNIADSLHRGISELSIPHSSSEYGIVTVSIGLATITPDSEHRPLHLIERADIALYQAKKNGRNQTCLYDRNL